MKNIINRLKFLTAITLIIASLSPALAYADVKGDIQCGVNGAAGISNCSAQPSTSLDSTIKTVINLLSIIVGIVSVIMIIIAGLRYVTSGGDAERVKSAKNTLLYALVGLIIVSLAQTIAHFVLTEASTPCSGQVVNGKCVTK